MKKRILVVDDNPSVVEVLKTNFELLGYDVTGGFDGEEAETLFDRQRPDLVILDVMMPKKNGYAVCRGWKSDSAKRDVPVVLLTAKNLKEDVYGGYDCGADAYVTKPYDPRQLEILVEQLIHESKQGEKKTAWTGLPGAASVREEHQARLEAGAESMLVSLPIPKEPAEAFRKTQGVGKYKDLLNSLGWKVFEAVRQTTGAGVVGQEDDGSLLVALHPGEADKACTAVLNAAETVLRDAGAGQDSPNGALFTLQWNVLENSNG